jgi:hypothetical protein
MIEISNFTSPTLAVGSVQASSRDLGHRSSRGERLRGRLDGAHTWVFFAVMGDLLMALLGSLIAFWLRFYTLENVGNFSAHELRQYMGHLLLGSFSLIAVLAWHGIYRRNMLLQAATLEEHEMK